MKNKYLILSPILLTLLVSCNSGTTSNGTSSSFITPTDTQLQRNIALISKTTIGCEGISAWSKSNVYATKGMAVVYNNIEYTNNWWTQGDQPDLNNGGAGSGKVWTIVKNCGISPTPSPSPIPTTSPAPSPTSSPVPSEVYIYPSGIGNYKVGTLVQGSDGQIYSCYIAGWCNQNNWAYTPATGLYWQDAWKLQVSPVPTPTPSPTPSVTPTVSPSPSPTIQPSESFIYSAYKDVGINTNWNTLIISTKVLDNSASMPTSLVDVLPNKMKTITWAFATGECGNENWAGMNANDFANANINSFNAKNLKYIVSTGGASGTFTCSSKSGMDTFLNRYNSKGFAGLDFDIEGGPSGNDLQNLINNITYVQQKNPNLRISFTLATLAGSDGASLNSLGNEVITKAQKAGINFYINLMVMDYGNSSAVCIMNPSNTNCDMNLSAQQAVKNVSKTYNIPYSKIEITPMIGVNDTISNIVSLTDFKNMLDWSKLNKLAAVHYWSFDRDASCINTYAAVNCSSSVNNTPMQKSSLEYLNQY